MREWAFNITNKSDDKTFLPVTISHVILFADSLQALIQELWLSSDGRYPQ
jgi:hypothetical protein